MSCAVRGWNRRAVSPVIAAVLLVLITVSVGTSLYLWYVGVKEETEAKTEGKVRQDLTRVFAEIKITDVNTSSKLVYIQNTGGTTLHAVRLYNGSTLLNSTSTLDISSYVALGYTGTLSSGDTLFVTTAEGATDRYRIS